MTTSSEDAANRLLAAGYHAELFLRPLGYNGVNHGYKWFAHTGTPYLACMHGAKGNNLAAVLDALLSSLVEHEHETVKNSTQARKWERAHPGSRYIIVEVADDD